MTFELIQDGYILLPRFQLHNEDGVRVFTTLDLDPTWRKKKRSKGTYTATAWVPGNFLAEGNFFVGAFLLTLEPRMKQFGERDIVGFNVYDRLEGDSARGDWAKEIGGVVRPLLKWETDYTAS
jgi:lipopolysaccharide transport system ATP-binding protein